MSLFVQQQSTLCSFTSSDSWVILSPIEQSIKKKIEAIGIPLKDWNIQINYGIKTGYNDAFIIDTDKRNEILSNCKSEEEKKRTAELIRPILRGRDIKRYSYDWAGIWLIYIPWHFPLQFDNNIMGASEKAETEFKRQYPSLYMHMLQYKESLMKRNKAETGIRYEWYALQRWGAKYWEDFSKHKIMYSEIVREPQFYLDIDKHFYPEATTFILTGEHLEYLIQMLNSSIIAYFFKTFYAGGGLGESGYRYKKKFLESLPIPRPIQKSIINDEYIYNLYQFTPSEIEFIQSQQ